MLDCGNYRRAKFTPGSQTVFFTTLEPIRLHFVNILLHLRYRGPNRIDCAARVVKRQELGWFEHGSTIIVLAPRGFSLCAGTL